jgi:hypothetical protein
MWSSEPYIFPDGSLAKKYIGRNRKTRRQSAVYVLPWKEIHMFHPTALLIDTFVEHLQQTARDPFWARRSYTITR